MAAGMVRVLSLSLMPRLDASSSSSFFSEGMLGSNVVSSARSEPAASASSSIASLGFSTGTRTALLRRVDRGAERRAGEEHRVRAAALAVARERDEALDDRGRDAAGGREVAAAASRRAGS